MSHSRPPPRRKSACRRRALELLAAPTDAQLAELTRAGLATEMGPGGAPSGTSPAHHHEGLAANTTAGELRAMKVYLDNVIVSGRVRGDLHPPEEMAAVHALAKADEKGQIEIYTSRWSWAEQDRTRDDFLRVKLKESRGEIEIVADDHRSSVFGIRRTLGSARCQRTPWSPRSSTNACFPTSTRPVFWRAMQGTSCTLSTTNAIGLLRSTPVICCPSART